jgi:Ca2+/Na+ antiporter
MANTCFQLKRSYLALCFQLLLCSVLIVVLAMTLTLWLLLVAIIILVVSYLYFYYQPQLIQLEYLDEQDWTLTDQKQHIQRDQIKKIIDHGLYIIIFFQQHQPLAIWCDQLDWQDWKRLKVLAKLY